MAAIKPDGSSSAEDALDVLGVAPRTHESAGEVRTAVRAGLPFSAFEALSKEVDAPPKHLGALLGIPERTLARRKKQQRLAPDESDRAYRVARVVADATSVLGSRDKARTWLGRPNRALGGHTPLSLLDTDVGTRQVEDVLLRIAHGIHG